LAGFKFMKQQNQPVEWWQEEYGFFGNHYLEGDDSLEGYLVNKKQNLQQRTEEEVDGIVRLLDLKPKNKVLDVPCGYGRHLMGLSKLGMEVVGVDINSVHLDKAKKEAALVRAEIEFKKEDMLGICYNQEFDAVINMFYSFGFFKTDEENFKVLQNFYNSLKFGGNFLFHTDVSIPRILKGKYKERETRKLSSGNELEIVDKYDSITKRINGYWKIKRTDGSVDCKDYSVRVYEKDEFIFLCKKAGFVECSAFSNWNADPYTEDSEDMIIVAKK
jgi:SAM-dependent methyltransferase